LKSAIAAQALPDFFIIGGGARIVVAGFVTHQNLTARFLRDSDSLAIGFIVFRGL
jgi:hypothetical protein